MNERHVVVCCSHPSPLSCTRPVKEHPAFMSDTFNCFELCNDALVKNEQTIISWSTL